MKFELFLLRFVGLENAPKWCCNSKLISKVVKMGILYRKIVRFELVLLRFVGLQNTPKFGFGALWSTTQSNSRHSKLI